MNCAVPNCGGTLRISHTYTVGIRKFQRATCSECGSVYRVDIEATLVTARGEGAKAYAARANEVTQECESSTSQPSSS